MATLDEGDIDSQNPSNGGALKDSSLSADPSKAFSLSEDVGVEKTDVIRTSPWKRGDIDSQNPSNGGALKDSSLSADPSKAFSLSEDVVVQSGSPAEIERGGNIVTDLLRELAALLIGSHAQGGEQVLQLKGGSWDRVAGRTPSPQDVQRTANGQNKGSALTNIVSPSRFSPLLELGDNEFEVLEDTTSEAVEKEDIVNEVEEMEEGELVEDKVNLPKQDNGKGRKGDVDSQNPSNGGALKDSSLSADPSKAFSLSEDVGVEKTDAIRTSPWKRGSDCDFSVPAIDIVDGVASMLIPEEVFDEAELLWKRYEVGYFIGDAPHMGSIHATINRIWASPKGGSKIDVQFIEKNTVLFRIENGHTRARVIQRLYWHISDVPLVVRIEVPNKSCWEVCNLHPHTEKCTRLDIARVLAEVNLHDPLVEKIEFKDKNGLKCEIEVKYPWLRPRCCVCKGWGHKGSECKSTGVAIRKRGVAAEEVDAAKSCLEVVQSGSPAEIERGGNIVTDLLRELAALPTGSHAQGGEQVLQLKSVRMEDNREISPRLQIF
ncbi:hypothetical protein F2Q68_00038596 [Brassica cretica]|uniref:DUF4283 domain-containing protein n=1 Tax=Brassica cretica TaxID=69181 RepID=A0A8S9MK10_BRACR|nr:hypothetical protein F2Q68_00038596 [Brassica cretica]